MDIRSFDLAKYRRQLGIVSQSPFLFSGTVAENIRYARPNASDMDILALANQIGDGEWLDTLPQGLETEVGERGVKLSRGQKQMIVLARILALNTPILILDEPTSSVDLESEREILDALKRVARGRTTIIIAHRPLTVRYADKIFVIEDGRMVEQGIHEDLIKKRGAYSRLYEGVVTA